jgi:hypothetical protein
MTMSSRFFGGIFSALTLSLLVAGCAQQTSRMSKEAVEANARLVNSSNGSLFGLYQISRIPRQVVEFPEKHKPGTIVIKTNERRLYYVLGDGKAIRYGIGVGRDGFRWAGVHSVSAKREWPDWTPPPQMLKRLPSLPHHMAGGPDNPLGARAMYLGSTLFRIHGSNEEETIGEANSSGCFRMTNTDVIDLYDGSSHSRPSESESHLAAALGPGSARKLAVRDDTAGLAAHRRLARQILLRQLVEIILPIAGIFAPQLVQIVPAIDAGGVQVVEHQPHGIIADRLHLQDRHVLLAGNGLALVRRMALDLGARAFHPQIFSRKIEALAVFESNRQGPAVLVQAQLCRP